jgi:hypothetical protein
MLRILFGLALLVALAAAIALVPMRGRTVLDRWNSSHGARDFLERGYREAKLAMGSGAQKPHPGRAHSLRPTKPQARPARPPTPTEQHSDEDRAELDRIVAEHAKH